MTALLIIGIAGWFAAAYLAALILKGKPTRWRTEFPPESVSRGPNADTSYHAITLGGKSYWFTSEQLNEAHVRATKYG